MPRDSRQYAESGIYHIYVRGNNKEYIFKTKEEKETYLKIIIEAREKYKFKILAYAIMNNHAHILLKIENEKLSKAMQNIQQKYTYYYNKKYNRTGKVFQGRYNSKACDEDEYLLEVIKYIHQNPEKAGLDQEFTSLYTSHKNYITEEKGIVDADYVLGILNPDNKSAREIYLEYLNIEELKENEGQSLTNTNCWGLSLWDCPHYIEEVKIKNKIKKEGQSTRSLTLTKGQPIKKQGGQPC